MIVNVHHMTCVPQTKRSAVCAMALGIIAFGFATLADASAADGVRSMTDEQMIAACIKRSAAGRGWLEKTLWGLRDQERGWIGAEIRNSDGSHDLGPLQVNSWWTPRLASLTQQPTRQIRDWLTNDPCFNVDAARWIFLSELARTQDYWSAVGRYHSPKRKWQQRYVASVLGHLTRRYGTAVFQP